MSDQNKICPHCGADLFVAAITRGCAVKIKCEGDKESFDIVKEVADKYDIELVKCARCHEPLKKVDLVMGAICKECGKLTTPDDIDESGVCEVCRYKHDNPDINNLSKDDLLKMLIKVQKETASPAVKAKQEKAKEVLAAETNTAPDTENTADVSESLEEKAKPAKGKRRKVKKSEAASDTTSEPETQEEASVPVENAVPTPETAEDTNTEAQQELDAQQDAPFPNVEVPGINPPITESVQEQEVVSQGEAPDMTPIGSIPMYEEDDTPWGATTVTE